MNRACNLSALPLLFFLIVLCLFPILTLVLLSFTNNPFEPLENFTLQNYVYHFTEPKRIEATINTIITSLGATVFAVSLGFALAWLFVRTEFRGKSLARVLVITPFFIPPFISAMAWTLLANPTNGLVNRIWSYLFNVPGPFNIYGIAGIIFVLGLNHMPIAVLMLSGPISSMSSDLVEQAASCGSSLLGTIRRVTLPILLPSIISTGIFIFMISAEQLIVPLFLGGPVYVDTLTTTIYRDFMAYHPPKFGLAVAACTVLMSITILGIFLYYRAIAHERRFVTVTGKGFRKKQITLGRWRYVATTVVILIFLISVALPIFTIGLSSLQPFWGREIRPLTLSNYEDVFTSTINVRALINSLVLVPIVVGVVLMISLPIAYVSTRTKLPGRKAIDYIANMPIAVPGIIFSFSILLTWVVHIPTGLGATLAILGISLLTRNIPNGVRATSSSFLQVSPELEEAAKTCGSSSIRTAIKVLFPLLRNSIGYASILTFIAVFRDIGSILFLSRGSTTLFPLLILFNWQDGEWGLACSMSIIMFVFMASGAILLSRLQKTSPQVSGK